MTDLTPETLERVGTACFGGQWMRAMADNLPVGYRTVQRWAAGTYPPPDWANEALIDLIAAEIAATSAIMKERIAQMERRPQLGDMVSDLSQRLADLSELKKAMENG